MKTETEYDLFVTTPGRGRQRDRRSTDHAFLVRCGQRWRRQLGTSVTWEIEAVES